MFEEPLLACFCLEEMQGSDNSAGRRSHSSRGRSAGVKDEGVLTEHTSACRLEEELRGLTDEKGTEKGFVGKLH